MSKTLSRLLTLFLVVGLTHAAHAGPGYRFTKLVDHVDDNFSPRTLTCASINEAGDVAFKGTRSAPDGLSSWDVIARVDRAGVITTIAEDPAMTQFQFFSHFVSINDSAQTSFGAFLSDGDTAIIRADGPSMTTIASTAGQFRSFGFDTSLNDAGEVAFTAQLDNDEQGLFSGTGGPVTTHYTNATPVRVDGATTALGGGNFGRPSINNRGGEIAFWDRVEGRSRGRDLRGEERRVPDARPHGPLLQRRRRPRRRQQQRPGHRRLRNVVPRRQRRVRDRDRHQQRGRALHRGRHAERLRGFGFYAPAINNRGQVAFRGFLTDFTTDGVFTGPNPKKDAILTSRDRLDGARILSGSFSVCSEALNNAGEVVFIVDLVDHTRLEGFRSAIYLASPKKPVAP